MTKAIFSILIVFSTTLFGQEIDSTKTKQIEIFEKIMYVMNSEIFKKQKYYSKLDKDYKFPWTDKIYSPEQLKNALDTLAKNSKIEIKEGAFSNLILEYNSYFPTYINQEISGIFKLTIDTNQIKGLNDKKTEIEKDGSTGFGSKFSSGFKEGKSYSYDWKTINKSFNIRSKVNKEELKGKISFRSSFILDYDYVKINESNIGESFHIGELEFKVIDLFDNKVVLDFKQNTKDLKFSFVNIDDKGNKISQIPYFNFQELKEKDSKISSDASPLPEGSQTMYKANYDIFKSKPDLSFDEYKKNVHEKFVNISNSKNQKEMAEKVWGKKYIIFTATDKVQNFFLYLPKNHLEKEFELKLD